MSSRTQNVAAARRERANARAREQRKAIAAVGRAEGRLEAEKKAREAAIAAATEKVEDRTRDLDQAIQALVDTCGSDQVAADLLDVSLSRIRSAKTAKTEVPGQ